MKRFKIIALALVAVFCVSAVAVSGASAATKKGEFVGSKGQSLAGTKFTAESEGTQTLETTGGATVKCETATGSGELVSTISATGHLLFKGCTSSLGGECKTTGAPLGEISAPELLLDVVLSPGHQTVLLLLLILKPITFICKGGVLIDVRGSLLASVGPELTLKNTFTFKAKGSKGVNEFTQYENSKGEKLTNFLEADIGGSGWVQADQVGTATGTLAGKLEGEFV